MASIKKQGNKYFVYYYHPMMKKSNGKPEQQYEDFYDEESAKQRKDEIEYQIKSGYFKSPAQMTVTDYFKSKFVPLYATAKWKYKTWDSNMSIWNNDILPFFGKMAMFKVKPSDIERFLITLRGTKVRNKPKTPEDEKPFISETTVRYTYWFIVFSRRLFNGKILKNLLLNVKSPVFQPSRGTFGSLKSFQKHLLMWMRNCCISQYTSHFAAPFA